MIIERKQGRRLEAAALPLFLWGEVAVRVEVAAGVLGRGGGGAKGGGPPAPFSLSSSGGVELSSLQLSKFWRGEEG